MDGNELRKQKAKEAIDKTKSWTKETAAKIAKLVDKGLDWAIKNPDKAAILGMGLAAGKKMIANSKERTYEDKRCTFWDGRQPWTLKRPMTTREQLIFRRRIDNGERPYDVLYDMRLLDL